MTDIQDSQNTTDEHKEPSYTYYTREGHSSQSFNISIKVKRDLLREFNTYLPKDYCCDATNTDRQNRINVRFFNKVPWRFLLDIKKYKDILSSNIKVETKSDDKNNLYNWEDIIKKVFSFKPNKTRYDFTFVEDIQNLTSKILDVSENDVRIYTKPTRHSLDQLFRLMNLRQTGNDNIVLLPRKPENYNTSWYLVGLQYLMEKQILKHIYVPKQSLDIINIQFFFVCATQKTYKQIRKNNYNKGVVDLCKVDASIWLFLYKNKGLHHKKYSILFKNLKRNLMERSESFIWCEKIKDIS